MTSNDPGSPTRLSNTWRLASLESSSRVFQKLLGVSLAINLLGVLGGGFYVYKTKHIIARWYDKYVPKQGAKPQGQSLNKGAVYPEDRRFYTPRVNVFNLLRMDPAGKRAIIFAGDSLIGTFEWGEYFADLRDTAVLNRGIAGDTINLLTERFESTFVNGYDSQKIFIMVGVNDISRQDFHLGNFVQKYTNLLERLSMVISRTKICIHSILPVRRENISNEIIKQINEHLRLYAQRKGICYIDLYDQLVDSTGHLGEKYSVDGIHLTSEGYKIWLRTIQPFVLN